MSSRCETSEVKLRAVKISRLKTQNASLSRVNAERRQSRRSNYLQMSELGINVVCDVFTLQIKGFSDENRESTTGSKLQLLTTKRTINAAPDPATECVSRSITN